MNQDVSLSLQPTYKELKQMQMVSEEYKYGGLQPTYKELKPWWSSSLPAAPNAGLQPTYKELKLQIPWLSPGASEPFVANL